jgi:hypothetical protein
MIHSISPENMKADQPGSNGLSLAEFTRYFQEIQNQPAWRGRADREMEYVDGNQLNSAILAAQQAIGMPPAIEPLIGPAIEAVLGFEAKTRTDWRITAEGLDGDDVADGINHKVNQAERQSGADKACGDAFKPQACVGMGWVEVARETDPFLFDYRCTEVHRNEIFWDMLSKKPDLRDARYLVRRRWADVDQVKLKFPRHADLIATASNGRWTDRFELSADGGTSTDMARAWDDERGWSIEEQEWRDAENGRVCLFEVWYRRWESVTVLKTPDGRVVEYDKANEMHNQALAMGIIKPQKAVVARMHVSFWMGPHKLHDGKTPYKHSDFPYVPFWGHKEDRTGVPFGLVRGMVYLQDNVNSAISKIRWGLSAVRTERTKGAVAYTDEVFRQMISRQDADIILNAEHMAQPGAVFKVFRDFQLNEQQYKMLGDSRMGIERASGISSSFMGQRGSATSGVQESAQIEQATQSLASLMDRFKFARTKVGELLLSLIIEDMGDQPETITIRGNAVVPDRTVQINQPASDEQTGVQYLTNDVQRTRLKVAMQDVPSTPSFRTQQLAAMTEAFKSLPQEYQVVALPHLLSLLDVPNKEDIIKAVQEAKQQATPEQVEQQIADAVKQALTNSGNDLKARELELRYAPDRMAAEINKLVSETVKNGVQSAFAAMQAGQTIAQMPQIAPIADVVMQGAGYKAPSPGGDDPNFPQPVGVAPSSPMDVQQNTSPQLPPVPQQADGAMTGIETARTEDNYV